MGEVGVGVGSDRCLTPPPPGLFERWRGCNQNGPTKQPDGVLTAITSFVNPKEPLLVGRTEHRPLLRGNGPGGGEWSAMRCIHEEWCFAHNMP